MNRFRPRLTRSASIEASGTGSSTTFGTPAQGPMSTETSSPAPVSLALHSPSIARSRRNVRASSSWLKTGTAPHLRRRTCSCRRRRASRSASTVNAMMPLCRPTPSPSGWWRKPVSVRRGVMIGHQPACSSLLSPAPCQTPTRAPIRLRAVRYSQRRTIRFRYSVIQNTLRCGILPDLQRERPAKTRRAGFSLRSSKL